MTNNNLAILFLANNGLGSGEAFTVPIRRGTDSWFKVRLAELFNATRVDDSAAHLLAQVIDRAKQTRTEIVVCGINDRIRGPLFAFDVLDRIPDDRIVETEKEARDLAWSLL